MSQPLNPLIPWFVETLLYGIFVALFVTSMYYLLVGHAQVNKPVLCTSVAMFLLSTAHLAVAAKPFLGMHDGRSVFELFSDSYSDYDPLLGLYFGQTLVGDAFLLYRLSAVWNRRRLVLVPVIVSFIGCFGSAIASLITMRMGLYGPLDAFLVLTLITNIACSALIGFRIWHLHRAASPIISGRTGSRMLRAVTVIVEAAALYVMLLVAYAISLMSGFTTVSYLLQGILVQTMAIVFSIIIIRVGMGLAKAPRQETSQWGGAAPMSDFRGTQSQATTPWPRSPPAPQESLFVPLDAVSNPPGAGESKSHRWSDGSKSVR